MVFPIRPAIPATAIFNIMASENDSYQTLGSGLQCINKTFHAIKPAGFFGRLLFAMTFMYFLIFCKQFFLSFGQMHRGLHHNTTEKVTWSPTAYRSDAFITQAKKLSCLGF